MGNYQKQIAKERRAKPVLFSVTHISLVGRIAYDRAIEALKLAEAADKGE